MEYCNFVGSDLEFVLELGICDPHLDRTLDDPVQEVASGSKFYDFNVGLVLDNAQHIEHVENLIVFHFAYFEEIVLL